MFVQNKLNIYILFKTPSIATHFDIKPSIMIHGIVDWSKTPGKAKTPFFIRYRVQSPTTMTTEAATVYI